MGLGQNLWVLRQILGFWTKFRSNDSNFFLGGGGIRLKIENPALLRSVKVPQEPECVLKVVLREDTHKKIVFF